MKKKKDMVPLRETLTDHDKDLMLAVLVRNPDVFEMFKDKLSFEQFQPSDEVYAVVWQVVSNYHAEHGELPEQGALMTALSSALEHDPDALLDGDTSEAEAFIDKAFDDKGVWKTDLSQSPKYADLAIKTIKKYREEHIAIPCV
jgi:hypothetical protein